MKQTIILTAILITILSSLMVIGTGTPFDQCIQVVDMSNGQPINTAQCYFTDNITIKDNVSMSLTSNGIYCTNINSSYPVGQYIYQINCLSGGDSQTFTDILNVSGASGCSATYTHIPITACGVDNLQTIEHTSSNESCQYSYNSTQGCNYCNPSITASYTTCDENGTRNVTYTDNNYASCCLTTGLSEDCTINDPSYNQATESCLFLTQNINCTIDPQPVINEKMNINCELPTDESTCCVVNVYQGNNLTDLLQSNPEYKSTTNTFILARDQETRTCFTPTNRLLNAYYTDKEIRPDTTYKLEIKCMNNETTLVSQYGIVPTYSTPDQVVHRIKWIGDNPIFIILSVIGIILFIIVIIFVIKKMR